MAKRKADTQEDAAASSLRRSTRRKSGNAPEVSAPKAAVKETKAEKKSPESPRKKSTSSSKARPTKAADASASQEAVQGKKSTVAKQAKSKSEPKTDAASAGIASSDKQYWLLKAEPESRFENGVDVRFSIDDLKSRTEPEPWDGIRNYVARNNLRAMKKGDLAFFYHSNCKEPGLVGTMEIVQEHSPDLSAHNPKAPYYDAKSKPDDPKWSVVHVVFHSKFAKQIGLQELREMGKPGQPLENMQMLKQSRLSVSKVSPAEWEYLMGVVEQRGGKTK